MFMGLVIMAWVFHAIPVATVTDVPPFARSLIWMSIAHHTEPWKRSCKADFDCYQRNCHTERWTTVNCCPAAYGEARTTCLTDASIAFGSSIQFGDGQGNFPDPVATS